GRAWTRVPPRRKQTEGERASRPCDQDGAMGMLCHHRLHSLHKSPSKRACSKPSSTIRGSGSPALRATRFVPVDAAQILNNSSEATWYVTCQCAMPLPGADASTSYVT